MVQWVIADKVDLSKDAQRQQVGAPETLMLPGDNEAHRWEITVLNNGEAADLTGASVAGYFLRSDGETVAVVGSVTGNVISVVLAQECYAFEGLMRAIVRVTLNGVITTVIQRLFRVQQDIGDQIIDPGEVIPGIDELLAQIAAMEAATEAANDVVKSAQATIGYYTFDSLERRYGVIVSSGDNQGKWGSVGNQNYQHVLMPVEAGTSVKCTVTPNRSMHYAFLKSAEEPVSGQRAPLCDGWDGPKSKSANSTWEDTAPADAHYLYLTAKYNGTDTTPVKLFIDGVDCLHTVIETISQLDNKIEAEISVLEDITTIVKSKNLCNPNSWMTGYNLNNSGQKVSASNRVLSDFIPVTVGKTYYLTILTAAGVFKGIGSNLMVACGFYTEQDYSTFIGPINAYVGQAIAPETAKYCAFSFSTNVFDDNPNEPIVCLTEGWYPTAAKDIAIWAPEQVVLSNDAQVKSNTEHVTIATRYNGIVDTVSHQGYKEYTPKSTKWAYIAAKEHGFSIAENDINFSAEAGRTLFMWHDATFAVCGEVVDADHSYALYTDGANYYWYDTVAQVLYDLDYQTASGDVEQMTRVNGADLQCTTTPWKLIKEIDVGLYFAPQFAGTKVMTFEEWTLLCKQLGLDMYADRKVDTTNYISDLVDIVKKHGMLDHTTWIINTNGTIGQAIRALDPNARLAIISRPTSAQIPALAELAHTGRGVVYDFSNTNTNAETIAEAHEYGFIPEAYYVSYSSSITESEIFTEIRRLVDIGCTRLTLDKYFVHEAYESLYTDLDNKLSSALNA